MTFFEFKIERIEFCLSKDFRDKTNQIYQTFENPTFQNSNNFEKCRISNNRHIYIWMGGHFHSWKLRHRIDGVWPIHLKVTYLRQHQCMDIIGFGTSSKANTQASKHGISISNIELHLTTSNLLIQYQTYTININSISCIPSTPGFDDIRFWIHQRFQLSLTL
jgi:hypothetical protein